MQRIPMLQFIRYLPDSAILCHNSDRRKLESIPLLKGESFSFQFSNWKYCTGHFGNGSAGYVPCAKPITRGRQCSSCMTSDVLCYKCTGESCFMPGMAESCAKGEWSIYLAIIGDLPKVGVTSRERFGTRLLEQGADYGMELARVTGGLESRMAERVIAGLLGAKMVVSKKKKLDSLGAPLPLEKAQEIAAGAKEKLAAYFEPPKDSDLISFLSHYPQAMGDAELVEDLSLGGKFLGKKGTFLFFESNGGKYVSEMSSFEGRMIDIADGTDTSQADGTNMAIHRLHNMF